MFMEGRVGNWPEVTLSGEAIITVLMASISFRSNTLFRTHTAQIITLLLTVRMSYIKMPK